VSNLAQLFKLDNERIIAFTGSGGKTTLMFQMAQELAGQGKRVVTTTTTKIHVPLEHQNGAWVSIEKSLDALGSLLKNLPGQGMHLTAGWRIIEKERKLEGIPLPVIEEISRWNSLDMLLIEADGSRGRGLKGYNDHEPVLPPNTDITIVIVALDALGHPYDRQSVHRHQVIEDITGLKEGEIIEASDIIALLLHEKGYLGRARRGTKILLFNRILDGGHHREAQKIAAEIQTREKDLRIFFRGSLYGMVPGTELYQTVAAEKGTP
jgi:probable selenium-dependent hydroxylase accessory protein YqeC